MARQAVESALRSLVGRVAGPKLARALTRVGLDVAGRRTALVFIRGELIGAAAGLAVEQGVARAMLELGSLDRPDYRVRTGENLGGVLGALAGTALGAAVGSAAHPGLGTGVGAFAGGTIGGQAGMALGRSIALRLAPQLEAVAVVEAV